MPSSKNLQPSSVNKFYRKFNKKTWMLSSLVVGSVGIIGAVVIPIGVSVHQNLSIKEHSFNQNNRRNNRTNQNLENKKGSELTNAEKRELINRWSLAVDQTKTYPVLKAHSARFPTEINKNDLVLETINSWLNTAEKIPEFPKNLEAIGYNLKITSEADDADDAKGTLQLRLAVSFDQNPEVNLVEKIITLSGFYDIKTQVSKQYDEWITRTNENLQPVSANASLWYADFALHSLKANLQDTTILEKINEKLDDSSKIPELSETLKSRGYKISINTVNTNYQSKSLSFKFVLRDQNNQIFNYKGEHDNNYGGLNVSITNFNTKFKPNVDIEKSQPTLKFVDIEGTNWKRLDITYPNIDTLQKAKWFLQKVSKYAAQRSSRYQFLSGNEIELSPVVAKFVDLITSQFDAKTNPFPSNVRLVSFNPELNGINTKEKQQPYNDQGTHLIIGGRQWDSFSLFNGMTPHCRGENCLINGVSGLQKELKHLFELHSVTPIRGSYDANNIYNE